MIIDVPDKILDDFLNLLDVAQASFVEADIKKFSEGEKQALKFVQNILGNRASRRFETQKERKSATESFFRALYR